MNLLELLNPFSQKSETKRFHEITKLGGEYSPLFPTQSSALSYRESYTGWVYTAVSQISNGVAKLPFHLLNDRDKQIAHDYLKLISYDLLESITSYLKLRGTAYIWKNTIGATVRSLHVLRPDLVTPQWNSGKSEVMYYEYTLNGKVVRFDKKEIIVIMNFNPLQAYPYITSGMSDLQASALSVDTERAQSLYNWKAFENGANPGGVLSTANDLSIEQIERMTTAWNNKFKGVNNANKLAVLTQGATFAPTSLSPQDMSYIEGKKLTRDEILAIFKVPKAVLGIGEGSGGNMNIRNFQELFARNAVEPVAVKISDALNRQLFNGIGRFEFYNIIPQDETQIRSDYQSGILTLNEARAFRGMNPVKDGDTFIYSDVSSSSEPTTVVQDEEEKKDIPYSMKSVIDGIAESLVPFSEKAMILKVKKRDKRLTKYEKKITEAIQSIANQQEKEVLALVKDTKGIEKPSIDFSKYKSVWILKMNPILKMLTKEEGEQALREVGSKVGFDVGSPEVAKQIKTNIFLLSKSVDSTTKDKLEKVFEKAIAEGLGAFDTKELIKEQFSMLKDSRAEAISRTETIRMSNEASISGWKQSGVVESQQWWTALDDRVSDICASLHGKKIPLGNNFFEKGDTLTTPKGTYGFDYSDVGGPPSHPNCFDKETEVYTDKGWKLFKELEGEKIWALNPETRIPEFVDYVNSVEYTSEKIVEYSGNRFSLANTLNHNQVVIFRDKKNGKGRKNHSKIILEKDEDLPNSDFKFYKGCEWNGENEEKININGLEFDYINFARFMGWYLSEGNTTKRSENCYQIKISQSKEKYLKEIEEDVKLLGIKYYVGDDYVGINNVELGKYLYQFGYSYEKYIPKSIKDAKKEVIEGFLDTFCLGDGSIRKGKNWKGYKFNDSRTFSTSSKIMADDIGECIMKIGNTPSFSLTMNKGKECKHRNGIYTTNHNQWVISENKNLYTTRDNLTREVKDYNDMVYDVELEKYHILLVRRNGKIVWSGNCRCTLIPVISN